MDKALAVILGAGPVGLAVGKNLRDRGATVRFVTRSGRPVEGFESVSADAADASAVARAAQGATILVHAVGLPYQHWAKQLPAIQSAVLAAAEQTGAVAVFVENLYSYSTRSLPITETTTEEPATRKGALRWELSLQWLEAHRSGRVKAVAVRASDYFGPGATRSPNSHFGSRFFPGAVSGKGVAFLGDPDTAHSYAYLPDFARALADVALDPESWGRSWIAPTMAPTTARSLTELFAAEAGHPIKVGKLPRSLIRALGWFDPLLKEVLEMVYQFEKPFTVDGSAFEARFGWKATDAVAAVRATWSAHLRG